MNCLECATKYEENIQGTIFKGQMVIIFLQIRTNLEVLMCLLLFFPQNMTGGTGTVRLVRDINSHLLKMTKFQLPKKKSRT